jgi:hypothetical protein
MRSRDGVTETQGKNFSSVFNTIYSASSRIFHRVETSKSGLKGRNGGLKKIDNVT